MKRSKLVAATTVVLLGMLSTTACGSGTGPGEASPGGPVEAKPMSISTWMWDEPGIGEFWRLSVDQFKSEHVSDVDVRNLPVNEFMPQLLLEAAQGTTGDVVFIGYNNFAEVAAMDALAPLDDVLADYIDIIDPGALKDVTIDGHIMALPIASFNSALLYNKKLFEEAGLAGPPKTPEEFLEAARKLTKKEGGKTVQYGYALDNGHDMMAYQVFAGWVHAFGGNLWDDNGPTVDSPAVVDALTFIKGLYDEGLIPQGKGQSDVRALYASGAAAMEIDGAWQMPFIKSVSEEVYANTEAALVPWSAPGVGRTNVIVSLSANAQNREGAIDYIRSLLDPALLSQFLDYADVIPQIEGAISDDLYQKKPYLEVYNEQLKNVQTEIPPMFADQYSAYWNVMVDAITSSLYSGVDPAEALAKAQQELEKLS